MGELTTAAWIDLPALLSRAEICNATAFFGAVSEASLGI
jgi:hypothetical protein